MSTSLQRDFFARHPEIYFLGCGDSQSSHGWISDEMASLGEVGLRYAKNFEFDERVAAKYLQGHFDQFEDDKSKKLLCFSSESMSFTMHFDIDVTEKAKRLKKLFGGDCKVLLIIRNQLDLFRSYYFECVRSGYPGQFDEFLEFNYFHIFRSILSDLYYDSLYDLYCKLFAKENVLVVPMELLVKKPEAELGRLSAELGIAPIDFKMNKHNVSDDRHYLQAVRLLNEKFPNNMGNTYFGTTDTEMLDAYWKLRFKGQTPSNASKNFSTRMMIYRSSQDVIKDFVEPLNAEYSKDWEARFVSLFSGHNRKLAEKTGLNLRKLGYPY